VFPAELEDDPLVLFYATPAENREAILSEGFRIPDPTGMKGLPSVSFDKRSSGALHHAVDMRRTKPGAYSIFAARYETHERKGLDDNPIDGIPRVA